MNCQKEVFTTNLTNNRTCGKITYTTHSIKTPLNSTMIIQEEIPVITMKIQNQYSLISKIQDSSLFSMEEWFTTSQGRFIRLTRKGKESNSLELISLLIGKWINRTVKSFKTGFILRPQEILPKNHWHKIKADGSGTNNGVKQTPILNFIFMISSSNTAKICLGKSLMNSLS